MLMNVTETMVAVLKSAAIPLAHFNAAATVDMSYSEMVDNVEVVDSLSNTVTELKH